MFVHNAAAPENPDAAFMQIHSYLLHPASVHLTVGFDRCCVSICTFVLVKQVN
jgi:hypothetical protein